MTVQDLPALNATLNAIASVLLTAGWMLIKQGRRDAHRLCMLSALGVSAAFLTSYLTTTPTSGPCRSRSRARSG